MTGTVVWWFGSLLKTFKSSCSGVFEAVHRWDHYSSSFNPEENKVPVWAQCLENVEAASDTPLLAPCLRDILTVSWTSRHGWFRWVIPWCFKYPSWQKSGGLRWVRDEEKHDSKGVRKTRLSDLYKIIKVDNQKSRFFRHCDIVHLCIVKCTRKYTYKFFYSSY